MHTVFVRVMGGLGNQIFQYAFAQWLRYELAVSTILFDSGSDELPGPLTRAMQLSDLFEDCQILDGVVAKGIHFLSLSRKCQALLGAFRFRHYVFDAARGWQSFCREIAEVKKHQFSVVSGYFQAADLVRSQIDVLRSKANPELKKRVTKLADAGALRKLNFKRDCIIHVRRGDYIQIDGYLLLARQYYAMGGELLNRRGFSGEVYFVSDDPLEAGRVLRDAGFVPICLELSDPVDVLAVIARAEFKVIANSTLSLWGGLLGQHEACVVFPAEWLPGLDEIPRLCETMGWIACPSR
jgi:hypothetical protein